MAATEGKQQDVDTDLPKSVVKRIVKAALQAAGGDDTKRDVAINKDALLAFSEGAKVFVSYLTATANEIAKDDKRQTISGEDVLAALEEIEFGEMLPQLRDALEAFKQSNKEKNKAKADSSKKRKKAEAEPDKAAAGAAGKDGGDAVEQNGAEEHAEPAAQGEDDDDEDMGDAEPLRRPQQKRQDACGEEGPHEDEDGEQG